MQILNYDDYKKYNNTFKSNKPKLNKKQKNNTNEYFAIASFIIIVILFNFNRGLKN